ncbi:MAG: PBP1A family penicillin-binding protein [Acidobacteria bacterium]|nr:MAG: PBP1A family penicillin-binding protein [Acidobacteriota bacterium]
MLGAGAGVGVAAWINMPEVDSLDSFVPRLITQLYDANGQVFRTYSRERRVLLEAGDLPLRLQQAVVAIEDRNFFKHGGIDLKGVLRAAWRNLRAGEREEGASTITMQLARELFLHRKKTWKRKIEEAFLAVELEKRFSKQQILTMYCNLFNEGHGNYGVEAAARNYFGKSVDELTLAEAAVLAGIPQRPSAHSVYRNPELVIKRRNEVLDRMLQEGYITPEEHAAAVAEPLEVIPRRREVQIGPYFAEEVRRHLQATYGTDALYDKGLQVYTTLDVAIQQAAEQALRDGLLRLDHRRGWRGPLRHLDESELGDVVLPSWRNLDVLTPEVWYEGLVLESGRRRARVKIAGRELELGAAGIEWTGLKQPRRLLEAGDVAWFRLAEQEGDAPPVLMLEQEPEMEGAVLVLESATGAIRAMVGGWSFERNEFNRATQARRQVGSAFKAFVFGAALENGFTPADTLFDGPAVFVGADNAESYSPRNYYRRYYGIITLRRALEQSINVSAVKLLDLVGAAQVIDFAHRAGITSELNPYPSLALGAVDLSPLELAAAYATIANQGIHVEPHATERIVAHSGRTLYEHLPRARKAMEPQIAYVLTRMLEGVIDRGTGRAVADLEVDLAGKTGTTDNWTDAWFVGFTPRHTILSWVGYDKDRSLGRGQTGAEAALPIWRAVVEDGLEEGWTPRGATFERPPGVVEVEIEPTTGLRPGPGADQLITETFVEGTEPQERYDLEWARIMRLPWYLQEPFYLPKEGERMPSQIHDWTPVREAWKRKAEGLPDSASEDEERAPGETD